MYYFITWRLYYIEILSVALTDKILFFILNHSCLVLIHLFTPFYVKALLTYLSRLYYDFSTNRYTL